MSSIPIKSTQNASAGTIQLPPQFSEPVRADLIKRAVEALQSHERQPYGADPEAGRKHSAKLSRRRRDYKGTYGKGISRSPRKTMSRNGSQMSWVGANAPNTVGGRRAFAPRPSKIWAQKINEKERRKALRSAIAATLDAKIVGARGHKLPQGFPFALDDSFESLKTASDVETALHSLSLDAELSRAAVEHFRGGRARTRGRGTRRAVGPLLVVSQPCSLVRAARNMPGVDVAQVSRLNAALLAPGREPARLTLFTKAALDKMTKERLFL